MRGCIKGMNVVNRGHIQVLMLWNFLSSIESVFVEMFLEFF